MPSQDAQNLAPRARLVMELAQQLGFALVGIAPAQPSEHAETVRQWISEGRHGEMHYLAEHLDLRLDPARLLPGARSVIAVADLYHHPSQAPAGAEARPSSASGDSPLPRGRVRGRVARYAWGEDYHKVIKKRLHQMADALRERFPDAAFRCTVDTAPALEREHAMRAGLGWVGKHTLLIHPRHGSWTLLGLILTTLAIQDSAQAGFPGRTVVPADHCGTCTRCIDACPTQCIENPDLTGRRAIDATRCISYLTLEHRGPIDPSLHRAMGDWIAGCDVCQEVCPFNSEDRLLRVPEKGGDQETQGGLLAVHPSYAPRAELAGGLALMELLGWTAQDRQRVFQGSALKRIKLDMLKRNALIAAGNHLAQLAQPAQQTAEPLLRRIQAIARDPDEPELVRLTARQVLDRLTAEKAKAAGV